MGDRRVDLSVFFREVKVRPISVTAKLGAVLLVILLAGLPIEDVQFVTDRENEINLGIGFQILHPKLAEAVRLDNPIVLSYQSFFEEPLQPLAPQKVFKPGT